MSESRRKIGLAGGVVAALVASIVLALAAVAGGAEKPEKVRAGNLELTFNGGFKPKALSKKELAPISLNVSAKIATIDRSHPPALKEFILETDKNGAIDVRGYPVCRSGQLQSRDTRSAEGVCGQAALGFGKTDVQISFPEQRPIPVTSKLILFNGGVSGGTTTLFVHAYITVPTPAAIVTTVKVRKFSNGRYGILSVASVPKIAGGSGSVTSFNLNVNKKFAYKGKKKSVLTARCADGKLLARGEAVFSDGTKAKVGILRTCTPKG